MHRKSAFVLLLLVIFLCGCNTISAMGKGVAQGVTNTAKDTGHGAVKDTVSMWQALLKADAWVKKNLW
ncbi:MAG: hypothetical protein MUF05_04115 [Candidatus Omnitrophica bacterium]|jgi:predicted small secreted protein|nr:hypothetical protein [Candidatus Omnitrophota bacterium]